MTERVVFNHVGQCVRDLDRSRRFYVELLGFSPWREINPPDDLSAKLLGLDPPLGMTACYLRRDGFVLELLHFSEKDAVATRDTRVMNEVGLTHMSLSLDIESVLPRVAEFGGTVLDDTNIGHGVFIRDPDGQLLELLPLAYAEGVRTD
jgi:lactoylglutathione lyase